MVHGWVYWMDNIECCNGPGEQSNLGYTVAASLGFGDIRVYLLDGIVRFRRQQRASC